MKGGIIILLSVLFSLSLRANNVRLVKEASISATGIVDNVALINMDIAWDNSWRDDFNWDAVYVFLKYKKKTETSWKHVFLMDGGHKTGADYEYQMAKSETTVNKCMGIFIQRSGKGSGNSKVSLQLRWLITTNGLTVVDFMNDNVEYQASCLEMVYVPVGAFCLGDGISEKTFKREYRPILAEWDCLSRDTSKMTYWASGNSASDAYKNYPPQNAVNRINNLSDINNAWLSTEKGETIWQVDFKDKPKAILYFGVSGLNVNPYYNYRPKSWELRAKNDDTDWVTLWSGGPEAWYLGSNSYPVQQALKVNREALGNRKFRYYQIHVITSDNPVVANNIAMTEVDMSQKTNDAFVVDRPSGIVMDNETNLSAKDGDTWSGTLQANYPTGFNSFYVMKYEISQEQWVRFLNKLEYNQQKMRTVGERLDGLGIGRFVYGSTGNITCRNGIAVGSRDNGSVVFVNNLMNDSKGEYAQSDDGQTVACNFLSPADMLAYADWCGLRPLSEFEYEKMARPPYPSIPILREWTGGDPKTIVRPQANSLSDARTPDERLGKVDGKRVNVNAGAALDGPVRVGAMAVGAQSRTEAGASFWGIMDLSGNLSEIYYACSNGHGRNFSDILASHGNGALVANTTTATAGNTDMSTSYWPQTKESFILRGGNFKSMNEELAISDRSQYGNISALNQKDSTVTFRLGHSASKLETVATARTVLTLMNGVESKTDGSAVDSVCSQAPYIIRGTDVQQVSDWKGGNYSYIWYKSENGGSTWTIIPGEEGCNLTYKDFYNESGNPTTVYFKRRTVTTGWSEETKYVVIKVINTGFTFNRIKDTITMANHCLGYWVDTKTNATFIWKWNRETGSTMVNTTTTARKYDFYAPLRKDFAGKVHKNASEYERLTCEVNFMGRCIKRQELTLRIEPRPTDGNGSTEKITINASDPANECGVVLKDTRGGKRQLYKTVRIGSQCWFAENLRYDLDGQTLHSPYDLEGEVLGYFYAGNKTTEANACPNGWKVATNSDFDQLITYLNNTYGSNMAGIMLKQGAYWWFNGSSRAYLGDNRTGFGGAGTGYYAGKTGRWIGLQYTDNKGHHFFTNTYYGCSVNNQWWYYLQWNTQTLVGTLSWQGSIYCGDGYNANGVYYSHPHNYMWAYRGWQYERYYFPIRCIKK
ncbi:MAG: SUMF1/EgtB/PvdO family nonheme iron enzyme [Odoribacter sp.]|nr:SUMF1/EgtB/PvdO family nonheme iron enzyme [Odoribacter sp.]